MAWCTRGHFFFSVDWRSGPCCRFGFRRSWYVIRLLQRWLKERVENWPHSFSLNCAIISSLSTLSFLPWHWSITDLVVHVHLKHSVSPSWVLIQHSRSFFKTISHPELLRISTPNAVFFSNTANPASTVAVKSLITSRNFAFSRVPKCISIKSRIPRISFQTLSKDSELKPVL